MFFTQNAPAQEKTSVLLAERPNSLSLFNQYEQRLSRDERDILEPFEPMRILRASALLSDGFTRCMSLEIAGLKFYLELDEHGKPVTTLPAGVLRIYRDATLYDDTVQVISAIVLTVPAGPKTRLEGNAKLRRLFSHGSETYALHLGEPRLRGWVSLDRAKENVTWRVLQPTSVRGIPSSVADRIASRINDTNRRLQSLYELFSRESGIPRESPLWQIRKNDDGILCILAGDSVFHQQSTRLLAREFGGFLIGTNLHVTIHPGRIEINERR